MGERLRYVGVPRSAKARQRCEVCGGTRNASHYEFADESLLCGHCAVELYRRMLFAEIGKCSRCERARPTIRIGDGERSLCVRCIIFEATSTLCGECGEQKIVAEPHPLHSHKGRVCFNCYMLLTTAVGTCVSCGNERPLTSVDDTDPHRRICKSCYNVRNAAVEICDVCEEFKRTAYLSPYTPSRRICCRCYELINLPQGECSECHEEKRLRCWHPADKKIGRVCATCAQRLRQSEEDSASAERVVSDDAPAKASKSVTRIFGECTSCKKEKHLRYHHPLDRSLGMCCSGCWKRFAHLQGNCAECGVHKRLHSPHPESKEKGRICAACVKKLAPIGHCAECGVEKRLDNRHPVTAAKICGGCRQKLSIVTGQCGECSNIRHLRYNHPIIKEKGKICYGCYELVSGRALRRRSSV